ncbi:DnaJ-domain-containing protein [Dichomitus squalens LYAD-421 SS1]|uniref:DnaJ-domain-containing protein n=2 Tax=Dichomitus squalens TaxID=114155 RepID=A0A4Q9MUM3_9APHY|nr:DnaJ-domain-containing protein [Dichomitus squalens LYAD-421 SS1]EJF55828.1 DnaJ-domain-containing protein [Dichomitus squalens LYAD-421 SS1]TBU31654.1 DnaJ-domain-containing protein [Dichomitus squalens]
MHSSEEPPFAFYEAGPSSTPKRKPDERTRAEQVKRDKPEQLWFSANEAFAEERYDDALALLTEAIALAPGNASYYVTRAATHMELCHFAAALRDFEVASTKTTYEPSTINHLRIARCRLILGSPSSALLALRDALSLDASNADALQMRRRVTELEGHMDAYKKAMARKHWRSARNEYESCLSVYAQQDSDAPEYVQCWGVELLIAEGKWDEATKSVDVLLHNTPNDIEVMTLRALVLFLKAESSAALTQVVTVLKLDPDNQKAKALWNRVKDVARQTESGEKALRQSDYETVINSWTNALLVAGEREEEGRGGILRAVLLLNRAEALCKLGKSSEGLKDVQESLKLHPTYSKAFLCRARIMIGLELFETAAVDFRASLEHGEATLSAEERCDIEAELEDAVRQAEEKESTQQDHYAVLGLTSSCTASEIKKAYRMLSLKHHPDKGGIEEKFKQLSSAYEILSDEEKKQAYDATLHRSYRQSWWWAQYNDDSHDYKTNYNYNEA